MTKNLLIAGGSVRAAAESAIRAGFTPWCVDCFGDVDLVRACPVRVSRNYPHDIPEMLASGPADCGWMYTGAIENHPEIIEAVQRALYGNSAGVVRIVRDPIQLYKILAEKLSPPYVGRSDFAGSLLKLSGMCESSGTTSNQDGRRRWVLKPRSSGGGIGIRFWQGEAFDPARTYLQEWIEGEPVSAVFLGNLGQSECVGQTRQLIGKDWLHAPGKFHYCGSIFDGKTTAEPIGSWISWTCGITALFGVDGVERDGVFVPVEVNPRYIASVEIVERATRRNLVADHVELFTTPFRHVLDATTRANTPIGHPGKAILYAPVDFTFPAAGPWDDDYPFADLRRRFADLPHPGQPIRRGQPVLTFFADGDSPASTEAALRKKAGELDWLLFGR